MSGGEPEWNTVIALRVTVTYLWQEFEVRIRWETRLRVTGCVEKATLRIKPLFSHR